MSAQVTPKKTLRIGIMLDNVQLMDIMGIDLFANLSRDYFNFVRDEAPAEFKPVIAAFERHALDIEYFYLAPTKEPTTTTARFTYLPTVTYDECPRDLDILLIGGPLPSYRPPQADRFMKEAWWVLFASLLLLCSACSTPSEQLLPKFDGNVAPDFLHDGADGIAYMKTNEFELT